MSNEDSEIFRAFGFKEETARGVAEATPEMWCDIKSADIGLPKDPNIVYEGGMGKGNNIHRPGAYSTTPSVEMGVDLLALARMTHFALGNRIVNVTEGDGSPSGEPDTSTEYLYPSDKILLPSFTAFFVSDVKMYTIPGCVVNKYDLSVDNEFIMLKVDMAGMNETASANPDKDTVVLNDSYPLAFHEVDAHMRSLGSNTSWGSGTIISDDVKKLSISIDNGVKAEDGLHIGSRFPKNIPSNSRKMNINFDYDYLTNTYYDLMQGGSTGPAEGQPATEFEMMFAIDGGSYGSTQLFYPRNIVTEAPIQTKGRETSTQGVSVIPFRESVTIPTSPTQTEITDMLATFVHNFADTTTGFDGPAEFDD